MVISSRKVIFANDAEDAYHIIRRVRNNQVFHDLKFLISNCPFDNWDFQILRWALIFFISPIHRVPIDAPEEERHDYKMVRYIRGQKNVMCFGEYTLKLEWIKF